MPHARRIAQGLLFAFTVSTMLPPVPAWALRQGAAAQNDETTAGLEEGLTDKPTTMNRREFFKALGTKVAPAAAVGAGLGRMMVANPTGEPPIATGSNPIAQELTETAATIAGAAVMGTAVAVALAPADAGKLLAEQLSTVVGDVRAAASDPKQVLVFVDREVVDIGLQKLDFRTIPGYPNVRVVPFPPFTEAGDLMLSNASHQHVITIVADTTIVPSDRRGQGIVTVRGLNGQRVVDSLLPVLITEAIAQWRRGTGSIDGASYRPLRDLTVNQVWQVLSSQFA